MFEPILRTHGGVLILGQTATSGLFKGRAKPKVLTIGEAGQGHSFLSQVEGPITLRVKGKDLPLFLRTIYADQVHENIMSVPEAVDQDYLVLFGRNGVWLFNPEDIKLLGKPVLSGFRDKRSRLFYFDFPSRLTKGTPVPAAGPLPPAPPSDPQVNLSQSRMRLRVSIRLG